MARQLFIGLITEGPTDVRFLQSVVERTFIDVAFECENDLEPVSYTHLRAHET